MYRSQTVAALFALAPLLAAGEFSGPSALEFTRKVVAFGPRPSGSPAARSLHAYVLKELKSARCQVIEDAFTARTPVGPVAMKNIIARFLGSGGKALAVSGHYDTKRFKDFPFLGANDGGSSAGFLLELARVFRDRPHKHDLYLIWFDGEEAIVDWTATDSLYGSRHLAARWAADGTLARMIALINVDMIGDRNLRLEDELISSESLRAIVRQVAAAFGLTPYLSPRSIAVEDDHAPFLRQGVRALDLIDFEYGPGNSWWHTREDTLDKLSPNSFQVVGTLVLETLKKLDQ